MKCEVIMSKIIRNCKNCDFFGSEGDGPEYNGSWPVCNLTYCNENIENEEDDNTNKVGFPFETEQACHVPAFWQYVALDEELSEMIEKEISETSNDKFSKFIDERFEPLPHGLSTGFE